MSFKTATELDELRFVQSLRKTGIFDMILFAIPISNRKEKYLDCCDVTLWASPRQEQRELSQNRY